jgi:hypothetical protein
MGRSDGTQHSADFRTISVFIAAVLGFKSRTQALIPCGK